MSWKWAVAGAMALGLGAAGTAQAATYLVTVTLTEVFHDPNALGAEIRPIVFNQIVHTGPLSGGPVAVTDFGAFIRTQADGAGSADGDLSPFEAGLAADIGLDDSPLAGGFTMSELLDTPPGGASSLLYSLSIGRTRVIHLPFGAGISTKSLQLTLGGGPLDGPATIAPLTDGDFGARFLGGGQADLSAVVNFGDTNLSYLDYQGTYSAVATVPEPAAWALMIAGFGLAGAGLRRRKSIA
jgi:hypothetical protein